MRVCVCVCVCVFYLFLGLHKLLQFLLAYLTYLEKKKRKNELDIYTNYTISIYRYDSANSDECSQKCPHEFFLWLLFLKSFNLI